MSLHMIIVSLVGDPRNVPLAFEPGKIPDSIQVGDGSQTRNAKTLTDFVMQLNPKDGMGNLTCHTMLRLPAIGLFPDFQQLYNLARDPEHLIKYRPGDLYYKNDFVVGKWTLRGAWVSGLIRDQEYDVPENLVAVIQYDSLKITLPSRRPQIERVYQ